MPEEDGWVTGERWSQMRLDGPSGQREKGPLEMLQAEQGSPAGRAEGVAAAKGMALEHLQAGVWDSAIQPQPGPRLPAPLQQASSGIRASSRDASFHQEGALRKAGILHPKSFQPKTSLGPKSCFPAALHAQRCHAHASHKVRATPSPCKSPHLRDKSYCPQQGQSSAVTL